MVDLWSSFHISFTFRYVPEGMFLQRRQETQTYIGLWTRQDSPMLTCLLKYHFGFVGFASRLFRWHRNPVIILGLPCLIPPTAIQPS